MVCERSIIFIVFSDFMKYWGQKGWCPLPSSTNQCLVYNFLFYLLNVQHTRLSKIKGNTSLITLFWDNMHTKCYKKFPVQHLSTFAEQASSLCLFLGSLLPSSCAPVTRTWLGGNCWEPPQNTSARQPGRTIACHCTGWKKKIRKIHWGSQRL